MKKSICLARARALPRLALLPLCLSIALPALAQGRLPEVVVSASRFAEPAAALPFGASVITSREIEQSGVTTVNEAIMRLLGVVGRLDTSGGNNYTLDLRGFGNTADSNQVVIVDGLRLNESDLTSAGLSSIPIESVDRIEVLRGTGQTPDFTNLCRMPSYATADLRYAYQWGAAELALGIANLTDHRYYTQAFPTSPQCAASGGVTTAIYPESGRTVTASLRYKF